MTLVVLAAIGVTGGLVGIVRGLRPARQSAATMLLLLDRGIGDVVSPPDPRFSPVAGWRSWANPHRRAAPVVARILLARGVVPEELTASLRATGLSLDELLAQAILGALAGLLIPLSLAAAAPALGGDVPWAVTVSFGLAVAVVGLLAPFLALRSEGRRVRREARTVVGSFLDLVVMGLASGMGIEGALHAAARVSNHPFSARLANALDLARHAGQTPWSALGALGDEVGVPALAELAASVALAGTEGARIRATLVAKSASIRRHELSEAEADANTLTERLFLPGVFLLVGFLLFVGYPAVARIAGGF